MNFKAKIIKINKIQNSKTENINYVSYTLMLIGIGFIWIYSKIFEADILIPGLILFSGYLLIFINYFLQYNDFEKIDFDYCGELNLNNRTIKVNDLTIPLIEIKKLEIIIDGFYGERINSMRRYSGRIPAEKNSLGVKNKMRFTHNSKYYEFTFELRNGTDLKNFNVVLYNAIMMKSFANLEPKESIKLIPKMYKRFEKTRDYIACFIKTGQISSTEGLLLMEYESDSEAKELRKKYCA